MSAPSLLPTGETAGGWYATDARDGWARAIAGDDSRLRIGHDFGAEDARCTWPANLPERTPYAVRIADTQRRYRLIALDFDASRETTPGDAARQAQSVAEILEAIGVRYVLCASDGTVDGGRHLFIPLRRSIHSQVAHRIVRAIAQHTPTLDIAPMLNPREGCIRPPMAPHKGGGASRVIRCSAASERSDNVPADVALELFEQSNPRRAVDWIVAAFRVPRRSRSLSKLDEALRSAQPGGQDQTPSAVVMRVVRLAALAGVGADALLDRADRLNGLLAEKLRRPHGSSPRRVDYEYARLQYHPDEPRERRLDAAVERTLTEWTRVLALELWPSQREFRQRELLRVLIAHAARLNTVQVHRSLSDLADDMGCSKAVVHESLRELRARLPQLTHQRAGAAKDAACIHFTPLPREIPTSSSTAGQAPDRGRVCVRNLPPTDPRALSAATADLFASHVRGAGPRGAQIIELLRERPRTAHELADALALNDAVHVRRYHLANLQRLGIADRHGGGVWYATGRAEDAHRIALEHGCSVRPAARRRRHANDRLDRREQRYDATRERNLIAALEYVRQQPHGATPAQVQHALGLDSPSLARDVVGQLAKQRLVRRSGDRIVAVARPSNQLTLTNEPSEALPTPSELAGRALELIDDTQPVPTRELAERLQVPTWLVAETVMLLRAEGKVVQDGLDWRRAGRTTGARVDRSLWLQGLSLDANRVVQALATHGPQAMHELAGRSHLRVQDLAEVLSRLRATGCVVEHDQRSWTLEDDLAAWLTSQRAK